MPLAFVDVSIGVNHSALTLRHAVDPVAVVSVTVFEEESTSSVLLVLEPVTSILSPELACFVPPVCALTVFFVHGPHAFVLVAVFIELDTEALLAVISPVSDVSTGCLPDLAFDGAIFLFWLLLDPVDASMGAVFLSFGVTHFPEVDEWGSLLEHHGVLTVLIVLLTINTLIL
jgi:hypothetical protein